MPVTTKPQPKKVQPRYRLLAPAAYSETAIPSLRLTRSSRMAHRIGRWILTALLLTFVGVAVAPWQQSVKGSGNVFAYDPQERQQILETPIKGRIETLGDGIVENRHVKEGDLIARIVDVDPEYLLRLKQAKTAAEDQLEAARAVLEANESAAELAKTVVTAFETQLATYRLVREQEIAAADADVASAENKVTAELAVLTENKAALAQIELDYERFADLVQQEIVSVQKYQQVERKLKEQRAKVKKADAYVESARNELKGKRSKRLAAEQKADVNIAYAQAALQKATSDVAKYVSEVAKAEKEVNSAIDKKLQAETKVARQANEIRAPFDGFLTKITPNNQSKILKPGDPICTIVPDTKDRAVQVWLDGNDAPLVQPGRHVRLQFEGWPAVQFAGWPSVAVGTFGGEVISVDATDNGKGKFRILILPDETEEWPNERFLRQGVRANGWVLLDQVPLWYEIWRNMNGFPPVVSTSEPKSDSKPPKIPKP